MKPLYRNSLICLAIVAAGVLIFFYKPLSVIENPLLTSIIIVFLAFIMVGLPIWIAINSPVPKDATENSSEGGVPIVEDIIEYTDKHILKIVLKSGKEIVLWSTEEETSPSSKDLFIDTYKWFLFSKIDTHALLYNTGEYLLLRTNIDFINLYSEKVPKHAR